MAVTVVEGRTRWKRFAVVLALSLLTAGVLLFALAQGAVGASFAVSGSNFKISASQLRGNGFVQFGSIDRTADGAHRWRRPPSARRRWTTSANRRSRGRYPESETSPS